MTPRRRKPPSVPIPPQFAVEIAPFPADLRALVEDELSAGNEIVEVSSTFPAPPAGAYVMLARAVTTREHADKDGIACYQRNMPDYSWEWHDAKRFWFVLEPPLPPEPEPDMDAIRAARGKVLPSLPPAEGAPKSRSKSKSKEETAPPAKPRRRRKSAAASEVPLPEAGREDEAVRRFEASMAIDYEKWHDGVGYDLDAIRAATPAGRRRIQAILLGRGAADWRDVEALAALDTPEALAVLLDAAAHGSHEIRLAVQRHAPHLIAVDGRTRSLVAALEHANLYGGLSQAIDDAEEFHPPEVMDALFRGALRRDGEAAVHFAALLFFLHGKSEEPFDWNHRPFFLKFHATDRKEREAVFRELCERVGVDAAKWLRH